MCKSRTKKIISVIMIAVMVLTMGILQVASLGSTRAELKVGKVFQVDDFWYVITSTDPAEVAVSFNYDTALKDIAIPKQVAYDSKTYAVTSIGERVFYGSKITSVIIPQSVTSIDRGAFWDCTSLTTVTITNTDDKPSKLTTIGESAFDSSGLTSIVIPQSVTSIGRGAFWDCTSLTTVTITNTDDKPSKLTTIGIEAFRASGLKSIVIPQSVASIGTSAFYNCPALTDVTITNSLSSKLTTIAANTFRESGLKSIAIPQSVTSIGEYAFYNCPALADIAIENEAAAPSQLTAIGKGGFWNSGITSIVIPQSVTSIGSFAFYGCSKLTDVTIENTDALPSALTTIESQTFQLSGITSIVIPQSVETIGFYAFANCPDLSVLVFNGAVAPTFAENLFASSGKSIVTYVPFAQKAAYDAIKSDAVLGSYMHTFAVLGYGPLVLPEDALKEAPINEAGYSQSVAATGGIEGETVTYKITGGALPVGLRMDENGNITGTATKVATFSFTVTAKVSNKLAKLEYSTDKAYTIKAEDTKPPELTVKNTEVTIEINGAINEADFLALVVITKSDNSKGEVKIITDFDTVAQNALGEKTVTITATDESGNFSTVEVTVKVTDTKPPTFSIKNKEVTIELNGNITEEEFLKLVGVTTTDNSDADVTTRTNNAGVTITTNFASVKQNVLGKTTVTITATDASGNVSTATITVNVTDTTPKPITEPTTEEPTTVTPEPTTGAGTDVATGDSFTTPLFFVIALFSAAFILARRKKEEELQG